METNFNILIISGCLQGILFATVILVNKKYKSTLNSLLAQIVLYFS